jgi:hypothetical protein
VYRRLRVDTRVHWLKAAGTIRRDERYRLDHRKGSASRLQFLEII